MRKEIKFICSIFVMTVIVFGLEQINYENKVFAVSRNLCCESMECYDIACSTAVTIDYYPVCDGGYTGDCYECLDLWKAGELCVNPKDYFCDDNGVEYRGRETK